MCKRPFHALALLTGAMAIQSFAVSSLSFAQEALPGIIASELPGIIKTTIDISIDGVCIDVSELCGGFISDADGDGIVEVATQYAFNDEWIIDEALAYGTLIAETKLIANCHLNNG